MLAGGAELLDRGDSAGGGGDAVTERGENRGQIPPLLRIIVYYQYLVIHVRCSILPSISPPTLNRGLFAAMGVVC